MQCRLCSIRTAEQLKVITPWLSVPTYHLGVRGRKKKVARCTIYPAFRTTLPVWLVRLCLSSNGLASLRRAIKPSSRSTLIRQLRAALCGCPASTPTLTLTFAFQSSALPPVSALPSLSAQSPSRLIIGPRRFSVPVSLCVSCSALSTCRVGRVFDVKTE